jgi:hypothetical protein
VGYNRDGVHCVAEVSVFDSRNSEVGVVRLVEYCDVYVGWYGVPFVLLRICGGVG